MSRRRYTLGKLKYETAQAKRQILTRVRKGKLKTLVKQDVYALVATRVGLKTDRTLWDGEQGEYLNGWYQRLQTEVSQQLALMESGPCSRLAQGDLGTVLDDLKWKYERQSALLNEFKKACDVLRIENEGLRTRLINKYGRVDLNTD